MTEPKKIWTKGKKKLKPEKLDVEKMCKMETLSLTIRYPAKKTIDGMRVDQKFDKRIIKYMHDRLGAKVIGRRMDKDWDRDISFKFHMGREV